MLIKKYGDRRLYDSAGRRYVKLEDIARMIREGVDVQVVDDRTGQDITRMVLTQIIVDAARDQEAGPPLQLLRQLVMTSDRATHEFLSWYMNGTLDIYHKARENFQLRLSGARTAVTSPLEFLRNLLPGQQASPEGDSAEVEKLRERVRELEALLAESRERGQRRPAARKRRAGKR
jgi:polyhydroxyalkanoate synthesis repressor PhaR